MNEIEPKFVEIERRVKHLLAENEALKGRVKKLDDELAQVRFEAQGAERFKGQKKHLREKVERILQTLEKVGKED